MLSSIACDVPSITAVQGKEKKTDTRINERDGKLSEESSLCSQVDGTRVQRVKEACLIPELGQAD